MMYYEGRKRGKGCRGGVLKNAASNQALQASAGSRLLINSDCRSAPPERRVRRQRVYPT